MAAKDVPAVRPEERRDSHQALKEGDIVAVLADDNPNYFWSVRLGRNFTGQLTPAISNAVYGTPPEGIPVVPHTAVRKYQRQANLQNLNAGVFSGGHVPYKASSPMNWCQTSTSPSKQGDQGDEDRRGALPAGRQLGIRLHC